jgi:transcriptional antiterminator RfaH
MPLHALEPVVHPKDLFDAPPDAAAGRCWWAFFSRARAEKSLARRLRDSGVAYFLPLHRRRWKSKGRVFNSYLPLFPGYVFVYGDHDARMAALQTNLVVRGLNVPDQRRLHDDLGRVHRLLSSGLPVLPEDRLRPGTKVLVTHGAFAGLEGTVLRRDQQLRFVVQIELLQRGVSLEVEEWMFQPLDTGASGDRSPGGAVPAVERPRMAGGI